MLKTPLCQALLEDFTPAQSSEIRAHAVGLLGGPMIEQIYRGDPVRLCETTLLRVTSQHAPADVIDHWAKLREHHPVRALNTLRHLLAAARFRAPAPAMTGR